MVGSIAGTGATIASMTTTNTATVDTGAKKPLSIKKTRAKNAKRFSTWFKEGNGK